MQTITPCLWFDGKAEEAIDFYLTVFPEGRIKDRMASPNGAILSMTFRLLGQDFIALNGGPHFSFTPAVSFFVGCDTQAEVDRLWARLSEGGREQRCGWLTDRFGLSWQIVPTTLGAMLQDKDPQKSKRVFDAMMTMVRLDIDRLKQAYEQG